MNRPCKTLLHMQQNFVGAGWAGSWQGSRFHPNYQRIECGLAPGLESPSLRAARPVSAGCVEPVCNLSFSPMLLINTRVQPSGIHGLGLFTLEAVPAGTPVWRFLPGFDHDFSPAQFAALPPLARAHTRWFCFVNRQDGHVILSGDHACFINHSATPTPALNRTPLRPSLRWPCATWRLAKKSPVTTSLTTPTRRGNSAWCRQTRRWGRSRPEMRFEFSNLPP